MAGENFVKKYAPGEKIIIEGESSSDIFILLSGELSVWRGRSELGRLKGHGDVIGELAAFTKRPRAATVVALTPAQLLVVHVELKSLSKRLPDALEKIGATIMMRYEIARTNARKYAATASFVRRTILHEVLVQNEYLRVGKKKLADSAVRKTLRERMDDSLAMYGDPDDCRVLKKIADESGVLTDYAHEISSKPWLEESIALRLEELENRFSLCSKERDLTSFKERASITSEVLDILGEYDSMPGIVRQTAILKLESMVPLEARIVTLRTLVMHAAGDQDAAAQVYLERKIIMVIEKCKLNSGKDTVMLMRGAEELGVAREYEAELHRLDSLSASSTSFLDAPPV